MARSANSINFAQWKHFHTLHLPQLPNLNFYLDMIPNRRKVRYSLKSPVSNASKHLLANYTTAPQISPTSSKPAIFALSGEIWFIVYEGCEAHFPVLVGFHYIQHLLQRPFESIHVTALINLIQGVTVCERDQAISTFQEGLTADPELIESVLPEENRQKIQAWLDDAEAEVAELKAAGEFERAYAKEVELRSARQSINKIGFGAHDAKFTTRADRDRKSVTAAIKRTIGVIGFSNQPLARHLNNSLHTGFNCYYQPERPVPWIFKMLHQK